MNGVTYICIVYLFTIVYNETSNQNSFSPKEYDLGNHAIDFEK